MVEDAGLKIAWLPPYSPDLNPIEETFAQLKAWIRKNRDMIPRFATYEEFLRCALETLRESVKVHFYRCRIGRTQPRDDDDLDSDFSDDGLD
jgi:transposase